MEGQTTGRTNSSRYARRTGHRAHRSAKALQVTFAQPGTRTFRIATSWIGIVTPALTGANVELFAFYPIEYADDPNVASRLPWSLDSMQHWGFAEPKLEFFGLLWFSMERGDMLASVV